MPRPEPSSRRRSAARPSPYDGRPWLASYPPGVPADDDSPLVPLTRLLDDAAASFPTRTALVHLGATMTYRQLKDAVDRVAGGLAALGVGKGDRVAVVLPNCPQNVIATYAVLRLGAVVVQHNPLYTEAELRHQLADCGATVVVCLDRVLAAVQAVRQGTAVRHVVVTSLADYLPRAARLRLRLPLPGARRRRASLTAPVPKNAAVTRFSALLRSDPARHVELDPLTDLALLQYTAGTTGQSKGAMLTHHNLVSNAYMNRLWDTGATAGREVVLGVLPLFHAYGLTVCLNATVLLGGTLVLVPRFDVGEVLAAIDRWRPTMLPGVPPLYKALADDPRTRDHDLSCLRVCVSGAMALPVDVQAQFEAITGGRLVEGYGLTETSPSTHCNPLSQDRRPGSIGLPLPGTRCKVVDPDDPSVEVPVGSAGELAVKGPQVFRGYWGRDSADVLTSDGYLLTGDLAVMDADGFFSVVDRKKELVITGGFNVYPSEVEQVLLTLPGVADAAVVGVPDPYRGESVKAFVVREPGADVDEAEVLEHCRASLTAYKVPRLVEFRDELPRSAVGKLLRRVLVEQERERVVRETEPRPASTPGGRSRTPAPQPDPARAGAGSSAGEQVSARRRVRADEEAGGDEPAQRAPRRRTAAPTTKTPTTKAPATKTPATKTPATKTPATKTPATKTPATKTPAEPAPKRKSPPSARRSGQT